jgi:hypothetical protein
LEIIYCGRGNKALDTIAIQSGFLFGMRIPNTVYFPPYFVDQNWKKPDRERYAREIKVLKPALATVLDLEREDQFDEVMSWSYEIAEYVRNIIIIPKYTGAISNIPHFIKDKVVTLGYSVPTKYGGTTVPIEEFNEWGNVHLLGGTPHQQLDLYKKFYDVRSIDVNFHALKANSYCEFWQNEEGHRWTPLSKIGIEGHNSNYVAFTLSCMNIMRAWNELLENHKV